MIPIALQSPPTIQQALSPQAIQARAEALEKAQKWNDLADFFESLGPRDRGLFLTYWLKALQRAQRWDRMLEVCEAAIPQLEAKTGPKIGFVRLLQANALTHLQRHGEALAAHLANGKLGSVESYRSACSEARLVPDWQAEESCADALLAAKPGDPEALSWKGESLAQRKNFQEAEPILRAALKEDPKQALAWSNLGRCLNEKNAWTEALEALDRSLALDPALPEGHYNRGRTNFELKRFKASVEDFRAALASYPGDPDLQANLHQAERYLKAESQGRKTH